jgi:SAM-dependent methyltransferase
VTGADISAGMLAEAGRAFPRARLVRADARALPFDAEFDLAVSFGALGHFLPDERSAVFAGVRRALRPGGLFAVPVAVLPPPTTAGYWALLGFDFAMRVRNAVRRPPFVMYYRTCTPAAVRADLAAAGFTVSAVTLSPRCDLLLARSS